MATKSINHKELIWSIFAIVIAVMSVAYCIQAFLQSTLVDIPIIFSKLKMLGAN